MKRELCLLTMVVGCLNITVSVTPALADEVEVTLKPGETFVLDLSPDETILNPNFWIHFSTSAHVHIRQHLHCWAHWTEVFFEWFHFHAEFVLPGEDSQITIENLGPNSVQFNSVMNQTCVGGKNAGELCMSDDDCPGGMCSAPICRGGPMCEDLPCPDGDVNCPPGCTCDVNFVSLAPGESITTPIVGALNAENPPECPDCLPRIENFWHWDMELTEVDAWLGLWYWSVTDFHFAIDEWWHMDTENIVTGVDGDFNGNYLIEITNNGDEDVIFTCESNMLPSPPGEIPTVSEWGLIIMALLLLTAGTIVFARRRRPAVA